MLSPFEGPLIKVLAHLFPENSTTSIKSWIKEGRVLVEGSCIKISNHPVLARQKITLSKKNYSTKKFAILYEDKHLVVIDKPAGMLSVATAFEKGKTVHAFLKEKYKPYPVYVVHRLDQETSGVMLFALSEEAFGSLKEIFARHAIERIYCGIVEGKLSTLKGCWRSYLYEDSNYFVHSSPNPQAGSLAITHYEVVHSTRHYTRLQFTLETGRKNQIRVHCQLSGHSIAGDKKYGATKQMQRLYLHAYSIGFIHPLTGKKLNFKSPIPENFNQLVAEHA